jgi:hypothetical protein
MPQSLQLLISGHGFEAFRPGLESRFRANLLSFRIHYSEGTSDPSLFVRLENSERAGELLVRESGHCDRTMCSFADGVFNDKHVVLKTAEDYHAELAALFLYVCGRADESTVE